MTTNTAFNVRTESQNPNSSDLDCMSVQQILELMNAEDRLIADAIVPQIAQIGRFVERVRQSLKSGGRLFYVGAGTSGRLGVLDASECPPTFGVDTDMVQGIIAGGKKALTRSVENAEDNVGQARRDFARIKASKKDCILGISASGLAAYVREFLVLATNAGMSTASLQFSESALHADVEFPIQINVGAEILAGSTRLKCGTATKMVLNMISTSAMVGLNKCYGNRMVDLRLWNKKLRQRALRLVMDICDVPESVAEQLLRDSGDNVKTAIVMHEMCLDADNSKVLLAEHKGKLRNALSWNKRENDENGQKAQCNSSI